MEGTVSPCNGDAEGELPRWVPPVGRSGRTLRVNNSMCNQKVEFQEHGDAKQVTWYICGPTVYDVAHVGHARNYVTSDIMRRILEDYFGYDLFYVMNVTDVDDKIILRARRNHLLSNYAASVKDPAKAAHDVKKALKKAVPKQEQKISGLKAEAAAATGNQQKELEVTVKQEELKLYQLRECEKGVEAAESPAVAAGEAGVAQLVALASDVLAADLDAEHGADVTDSSIFRAHAARYEREFFEDMAALGCRPPDVLARVTEYMPAVVGYVEKIVERGFGYASNGSVYFDTEAFKKNGHRYGKLCPWAVGNATLAAESEDNFVTKEKKSTSDFALWKASKPGEPFWESPWGKGRPGWHIECSAMASDLLGECIDIHSGGADLRFPHHENELAQAEAFYDCQQWVNYFVHPGHLHIEGLKMSKSLKNFITVREALQEYTARQLRLLFVLQAWDKPMNFGPSAKAEMVMKERQLKNFFQNVQVAMRADASGGGASEAEVRWDAGEVELHNELRNTQAKVRGALEDNFDTPGAMGALVGLMSAANKYLSKAEEDKRTPRALLLRKCATYVTKILTVFGLVEGREELGFGTEGAAGEGGASSSREAVLGPVLNAVAAFRDDVRVATRGMQEKEPKENLLALCDKFRDHTLADLGVRLEDRAGSSVWKLDDPEVLRKEREEKAAAAAQQALAKLDNKRKLKEKEVEKWEKAAVKPESYFRQMKDEKNECKYSAFDANGLPTHDAAGKELSAKARKAVEKEAKKAQDSYEAYSKKQQETPNFLDSLKKEVEALTAELARLRAS